MPSGDKCGRLMLDFICWTGNRDWCFLLLGQPRGALRAAANDGQLSPVGGNDQPEKRLSFLGG
ncbi:unnamed protein product, partial [Ectocarpus sp. 4 AP-2014]